MTEDARVRLEPEAALSIRDAHRVVERNAELDISDGVDEQMRSSRDRFEKWVDEGRRLYGVTTGFGPLADAEISGTERRELQQNLIYHLCTGVGEPMDRRQVRAMILSRIASLSRGHSALRPETLERLVALLETDLHPVVPSLGTVGASGDLTPLAHLALVLMGEGEVLREGSREPADEALASRGIEPAELEAKEGLALVNGTAAMTGLGMVNGVDATRAAATGLRLALLYAEVFESRTEAWDGELGRMRPHRGQQTVHDRLREWSASSERLFDDRAEGRRAGAEEASGPELPQDPYSARCLPQLYGAVLDAVWHHNEIVETELNSVSDNPVVSDETGGAIHGGNFYGQHVAFGSDHLANAVLKIAVHLERCVARLTDPDRNRDLPAFLQGRETGLHSGLMGAQVTATSLVAEMRSRSTPASTQSIPTNADNQDVVTMGTIAARRTAEHLDRLWEVVGIAGIACAQAFDLVDEPEQFSDSSRRLVERVRDVSEFLDGDRPLSDDISRLGDALGDVSREMPLT
jgi:tyrosine ammonia-lyase